MTAVALILTIVAAWVVASVLVCLALSWVLRGSDVAAQRLSRGRLAITGSPLAAPASTRSDAELTYSEPVAAAV